MVEKNNELQKFIKLTLGNNKNKNISLKGSFIVNTINKCIKEETKLLYKEIDILIEKEIIIAEQNNFTNVWGGAKPNKILFDRLKKDILIDVSEKLEKYAKINKLL